MWGLFYGVGGDVFPDLSCPGALNGNLEVGWLVDWVGGYALLCVLAAGSFSLSVCLSASPFCGTTNVCWEKITFMF